MGYSGLAKPQSGLPVLICVMLVLGMVSQALAVTVPLAESKYYPAQVTDSGYAASIATTSNGIDALIVGAPSDPSAGVDGGAVYVYLVDSGTGDWPSTASATLTCPRYGLGQRAFGVSVAADGEWLAVGSEGTSVANRYGAVDIYHLEPQSGSFVYQLSISLPLFLCTPSYP
ncbi:hypothetical protein KIPB_011543 [Kipferlia bialata]|uniref:Uncharacterized protein n=1 Tax=Kipferlia bialata TaxID=797122 RepID=A0A9K3D7Q1_9EUKA|nr:hypothetical protein KIPB_011543 [Kipferlia bialata]|eukprot:g11543.t1